MYCVYVKISKKAIKRILSREHPIFRIEGEDYYGLGPVSHPKSSINKGKLVVFISGTNTILSVEVAMNKANATKRLIENVYKGRAHIVEVVS